jgi:hypothetical protein
MLISTAHVRFLRCFFELCRLGFIVEKQIQNNINAFVEVERGEIYGPKCNDIPEDDYTLDNVSCFALFTLFIQNS